jgi:hypothetical protein
MVIPEVDRWKLVKHKATHYRRDIFWDFIRATITLHQTGVQSCQICTQDSPQDHLVFSPTFEAVQRQDAYPRQDWQLGWVPIAHTCNPSYSGGREQEDHGLKPTQAKSLRDPVSKIPNTKKD